MKVLDKKQFEKNKFLERESPTKHLQNILLASPFWIRWQIRRKQPFSLPMYLWPGCRNNWHIHLPKTAGGQLLICTAGEGWYQEENKPPVSLTPGTVITIPAEVKHWHGAKKDSWFSHIAVEVPGEDTSNEWCEPVNDEEYNKLEEK